MDFSDALIHLKAGERIGRKYWESGKMLYLSPRSDGLGNTIYFSNRQGSEGVYLASNGDLLAEDWAINES